MGLGDVMVHIDQQAFAKDAVLTADYLADIFYARCVDSKSTATIIVDTY